MYFRKIIKVQGQDSPNVRLALAEIALGKEPSNRILTPGVLSYREYCRRLRLWDPIKVSVGLMGEFYKGAKVLLFPPDWLDLSAKTATTSRLPVGRCTLGVDSAQGGDNTAWAVSDEVGLLDLISMKTPDTSIIVPTTLTLMNRWNIADKDVLFDAGGGGKPHADRLRELGYRKVRAISFGGRPTDPNRYRTRGRKKLVDQEEDAENSMVYKNRRAEMYGLTHIWLHPALNEVIYQIPEALLDMPRPGTSTTLRQQMRLIPLLYDGDGKMYLPPKTKGQSKRLDASSLEEIIGHSPDELDAVVLSVLGQFVRPSTFVVGRDGHKEKSK